MKKCLAVLLLLFLPFAARAADDPLTAIGSLIHEKKGKEARAAALAALEQFKKERDERQQARAFLMLAFADVVLDDAKATRTHLAEAAERFEKTQDRYSAWFTLVTLGELDRAAGQFDEAARHHEKALAVLQELAAPSAELSFDSLKLIAPMMGFAPEALGPMAQNPLIMKPLLVQLSETMTRDLYGTALLEINELDKAERELTRASELGKIFGGMVDSSIETHLGDLRRQQWRLEEAREFYRKALQSPQGGIGGISFRDDIKILHQLADLALLTGQVEEALDWNDKALTIVRQTKNQKREAEILEDRGSLLRDSDRFDAAGLVYDDALKLAESVGDIYRQASVKAELGMLNLSRGSYGSAITDLERAIELFQKIDEPYVEAPVWTLLAQAYLLLDAHDSARTALKKSAELAKKSHFRLAEKFVKLMEATSEKVTVRGQPSSDFIQAVDEVFNLPEAKAATGNDDELHQLMRAVTGIQPNVLPAGGPAITQFSSTSTILAFLRARVLAERGDLKGAREVWEKIAAMEPNRDLRAMMFGAVGATYWREGNQAKGTEYLLKSADAIEQQINNIHVEELLSNYLGSHHHLFFDMVVEALVQQGRVADAFDYAERARARAFLQLLGNHKLGSGLGSDAPLAREAESLRQQLARSERQASLTPTARLDLQRGRARYEALLKRVKVTNPEYDSTIRVEPLRLADVQKELAPDATLISYYVTPLRVHAWVVSRDDARHVILPIDGPALDRIVCWADQLGTRRRVRGVKPLDQCTGELLRAEEAFAQLIAPLQQHIHNMRLIFVPNGVLHYVPFAALRDPKSQRFLVEDFVITYAPSASVLRFLHGKESPVDGKALVIGDPNTELGNLAGARREAVAVAKVLGTTAKLGASATKSLILHLKGDVDLVHVAAHGFYDAANPLFSRLALASDGDGSGDLEVHEILSDVDLTGVNLVVLSACQTALGKGSRGDDVVGLTRAFLYAGTPGVISTLWNVDDAAAVALMEKFYERLLAGDSAAGALRQAQIAMLRGHDFSDPAVWAPFTLTGDPQGRWSGAAH
ncbi:MAG TPA: CHAT domain-containing protein [Thermoanaerobaculia bacterium]